MKLSLFAGDMVLYIENPKDSTKKLSELINEFSNMAGYKSNIEKSIAFLNTIRKRNYENNPIYNCIKKPNQTRDFPGGPVVKTPCFQCRGHEFDPWSGN